MQSELYDHDLYYSFLSDNQNPHAVQNINSFPARPVRPSETTAQMAKSWERVTADDFYFQWAPKGYLGNVPSHALRGYDPGSCRDSEPAE